MDAESLYRQVGRLIQNMPDLAKEKLSDDDHLWLGRAAALVKAAGDPIEQGTWHASVMKLEGMYSRFSSATDLKMILYRVLAAAELQAPPGIRGAFIPAGDAFDALAAMRKALGNATHDILIVDPYMDESVLTDFGTIAPSRATLRLLSEIGKHKPSLAPAAKTSTHKRDH